VNEDVEVRKHAECARRSSKLQLVTRPFYPQRIIEECEKDGAVDPWRCEPCSVATRRASGYIGSANRTH